VCFSLGFPLKNNKKREENETPCANKEKIGYTFTGCFNERATFGNVTLVQIPKDKQLWVWA
jgi:D-arabinose 1-dehydrogenase-like Zn-dependent alcohol dehydrogenase